VQTQARHVGFLCSDEFSDNFQGTIKIKYQRLRYTQALYYSPLESGKHDEKKLNVSSAISISTAATEFCNIDQNASQHLSLMQEGMIYRPAFCFRILDLDEEVSDALFRDTRG
jgi:hypothetical protein